ncbi:putative PurR-regulated permease PerM [Catalinimonas alkaloidigena]|uniref:AI-2E family transporter n=1 Tax=Catalinimonas alkaloidigena TaxID=1075417 RepID=UPI002404CCAD|nr:AI-2E family transporter [Catalinimonas alkaloidigena]MDF9796312.1 putative PurR-regulated permease PerM [Catalinimonas alkaloidigena]
MKAIPGYVKYFIILSSIVLTCYILILGKSILSPLLTALIIALLLRPLSTQLEKLKVSRLFSSLLSIFIVFIVLAGLSYFFSFQLSNISNDLNSIGARFNELIDQGATWMGSTFDIDQQRQTQYLKDSLNRFLQNSSSVFTQTVFATAGFVTSFFLFLISLFFFLYYRRFFATCIYQWFSPEDHYTVGITIHKIERVVRSYILGVFMVISIVAILNSLGLMLLGIQHAIFFGVLAAILIIIPYIGIIIGSLLPILFALVTKDSLWYPVGVLGVLWGVQVLESNFITPNIVGGKVSINPFAAILALFFSGMIWGIPGMVLSIPLLAIFKVICDAIKPLQSIGFLLGAPPKEDDGPKFKPVHFHSVLNGNKLKV